LRRAVSSKRLLLHAEMHDDNTANNGEGFRKFLIFLLVDYVLVRLTSNV